MHRPAPHERARSTKFESRERNSSLPLVRTKASNCCAYHAITEDDLEDVEEDRDDEDALGFRSPWDRDRDLAPRCTLSLVNAEIIGKDAEAQSDGKYREIPRCNARVCAALRQANLSS